MSTHDERSRSCGSFIGHADDGYEAKFEWHHGWSRVTRNANGITGWATCLQSTSNALQIGAVLRVHLCSNNPCTARHDKAKYGNYAPPMHLQPLECWTSPSCSSDLPNTLSCPPDLPKTAVATEVVASAGSADGEDSTTISPSPPVPMPVPLASAAPECPHAADLKAGYAAPPNPKTSEVVDVIKPSNVAVAASNILGRLLKLAREIRKPRAFVGYSFFILLALTKRCRPVLWEGASKVDLMQTFAPWAIDQCVAECAVHAVCVCFAVSDGGAARMVPVSEAHPLHETRHFVAAIPIPADCDCTEDSIQGFYQRRGLVMLGTVMDGDCGADCGCQMLGISQTADERRQLREEVSDYLIQRIEAPWMHDLMVLCDELPGEELLLHRSHCGPEPVPKPTLAVAGLEDAVVVQGSLAAEDDVQLAERIAAFKWVTGVADEGILSGLMQSLPAAVISEQMELYRNHEKEKAQTDQLAVAGFSNLNLPTPVTFSKSSIVLQNSLAGSFSKYLAMKGIDGTRRLPRHAMKQFVAEFVLLPKCKGAVVGVSDLRTISKLIRRWHQRWMAETRSKTARKSVYVKSSLRRVPNTRRKRIWGRQGRPKSMPLVRQQLFDWFMGMRYQIDWKAYAAVAGAYKCIGRFPRGLLRAKLNELIHEYCRHCLLNGLRPDVVATTNRWFIVWQEEFGVCMRQANRRYKIPKAILAERLCIWWLTLNMLRALCEAIFGYDLEMENFDQSPFHNNEVGAQNQSTLAIQGACEVPLHECRSDVLERWSGNFTTWSNPQRIMDEGPPYAELMFRAESEGRVEMRLKEYVRSGGFGEWLSVSCAEKGSYRESDVINFLSTHLPHMTPGRRWRIIMADDYGPHKSPAVFNLCWSRGYILVAHGGGVTPVTQTCDTDLNQHVRRKYAVKESAELLHQMRMGIKVPSPQKETCIDIMHDILSEKSLHLQAAKGYKYTGATVALDGSEDHMICREAGQFFKEGGMRPRIAVAIDLVRTEVKAGRLRWTKADIMRLLPNYPKRCDIDAVLARQQGNNWFEEGDKPYLDECEDAAEGIDTFSSDDDDEEQKQTTQNQEQEQEQATEQGAEALEMQATLAVTEVDKHVASLSPAQAQQFHRHNTTINALLQSIDACKDVGSMSAVVNLENEIKKLRRRQRSLCNTDSAVAEAMARVRDDEHRQIMQQRRDVERLNTQRKTAAQLGKELKDASALLKKRKAEVLEQENLLECRHAMKRYSVEQLGHGQSKGGGAICRKRRFEILDRMARTGNGLSAAQHNDWEWFKQAWDEKLLGEHKDMWASMFAKYVQKVLDDLEKGLGNAFSVFVHNETVRCFDGVHTLQVP